LEPNSGDRVPEHPRKGRRKPGAPMSMRAGKTRFRRRIRVVGQICALHEILFLLGEAQLVAEEEERFAKSRAKSFIVDDRVMKGLENLARRTRHLPPIAADEEETEAQGSLSLSQ